MRFATWMFAIGIIAWSSVAGVRGAEPADESRVPRKTGNLSITSLRPSILTGEMPPLPDPLLRDPSSIRAMGATWVEDYLTLDVIHREKASPKFAPYLANARACRDLRFNYAIYPWFHFLPAWMEASEDFVPYTNLETGETCRQPSGWAEQTMRLVDDGYAGMAKHLREYVDAVYVTDVAEYGELGYPNGYTQWLRDDPNAKVAWWCGDAHARADFRERMIERYSSLEALNEVWGTQFETPEAITYPPMKWLKANPDPRAIPVPIRRYLLDFITWYQDAASRRMAMFLQIAQRAFPGKPCEIKLGHADESAVMGHSASSACRTLADTSRLSIRSTHASVSYFHVKRVATPAQFYDLGFLTEPPGTIEPETMVERIFTDACCGVNAYFDYPHNPKSAGARYSKNIGLLDQSRAEARVALFFPESDHYLRISQSYPAELIAFAQAVRDVADFDVMDERLIADNALSRYNVLVILDHPLIARTTFEGMQTAINSQRNLKILQISAKPIHDAVGQFEEVDGSRHTLEPAFPRKMKDVYRRVIAPPTDDRAVEAVREAYADVLRGAGILEDKVEALTARDDVWAGLFVHRILLYNRGDAPRRLLRQELEPGTITLFPEGP